MKTTLAAYLEKRSEIGRWTPAPTFDREGVEVVIVIPALAEYEHLFDTLRALADASETAKTGALVLCVVNNRPFPDASAAEIENNRRTLDGLRAWADDGNAPGFQLGWIDASSRGHALPAREGVGLARKIGLDHGLALLAQRNLDHAPLVCLDADSPPAPGYLDALRAFYREAPRWAGYAAYAHAVGDKDSPATVAILAYETYMRYHELGLRWAGSPYAYPALGSIISCTAAAYAAVSGMNRRHAGEDFYFMQQLAKTGKLESIPGARVHPSGRTSLRAPFGTGPTMAAARDGHLPHAALYHPDCYDVLRRWFACLKENTAYSGGDLLDCAAAIHDGLALFLQNREFALHWDRFLRIHRDETARLRQFHVWFDGLRTIQLIHHLRDTAFPDCPAETAVAILLERLGCASEYTAEARPRLDLLRRLCDKETSLSGGLWV